MPPELIVIGGGPGGHAAALEGARLGLDVTLVERAYLGGTCLNWGCIPTKLFLGATAPLAELEAQTRLKLYAPEALTAARQGFSLPLLQERKRRLLQGSRQAVEKQLKAVGVTYLQGQARLLDPHTVAVRAADGTERTIAGRAMILALGSSPAFFPGLEPDNAAVLDSNAFLDLETLPESLIIVGGGAIGLELGDFCNRLGCKVTLVEAQERLAPTEDPEVGQLLARTFKRAGVELQLGKPVQSLQTVDGRAVLTLADGTTLKAALALVAVGRAPNTAGLGLETAGIALDAKGYVRTDEQLRAADGICAIGDCNGRILLAHAAAQQGRYAARLLAGQTTGAYAPGPMPACIYGSVEVMRTGPDLEILRQAGAVQISRAQLAANAIAQAHGGIQGFVKAFWQEGRVRAMVAAGHGVSQLAAAATVFVEQGWTVEAVRDFVFAHPGLDEALGDCLLAPLQECC